MCTVPSGVESRHESLLQYPVVITLPVQWGEQDSFGHVNNVVYFRWCESARISYLERIGLWDHMEKTNVGPIMASVACNYRRPVKYPDTVHIGSRVTRIGNSSFQMEHCVVSEAMQMVVAEADSTLVIFDYNRNEPAPMPEEIRKRIEDLEAGR